jgi:hypothetical protein
VKTCHCTRHTVHYFATDHPRGRIRQGPYPTIPGTRPYPFTVDPPRPSPHRRSTRKKGRRDIGPGVFSPSHPLRHHGVQGWLAILGARGYSSLHSDRQNFPRHLCLLLPYKRAGGELYNGGERRTTDDERPVTFPP